MPRISIADIDPRPTVLTVGVFDGVHLGHRSITDRVVEAARQSRQRSAVVTFDPHPRTVLQHVPVSVLTTLDEKTALLSESGIDHVIVVRFDSELSQMTPEEFITHVLIERIGLTHIVVGFDHSLGRGASGNAETIASLGPMLGFTTEIIGPIGGSSGAAVSSSRIRSMLLDEGNVRDAGLQLGRPYTVAGRVVHGDGRGKEVGFPTANLELLHPDKVVPANGVYAVRARRQSTMTDHDGVMNIGVRPTLTQGLRRALEVHVLEFDEDIYGEELTISFIGRIRDERMFNGIDELRAQISTDLEDCIRILSVVSYSD